MGNDGYINIGIGNWNCIGIVGTGRDLSVRDAQSGCPVRKQCESGNRGNWENELNK